ncbi:helix-turn-helix transcriptional regulator [Streptomyces pactum]|uniref:Helix-turn-helix transcriptional regulator n=1 Tax=Streptomyces pactum TaxID=68249 RepID=A0ABS0NTL5_9ACTN|nr:helix-turn-helix transcriptional regulator [Streptomyces pactum]MBH5338417.1 helix-turn-helix transcriptional regulator [Streptomyces pactum]
MPLDPEEHIGARITDYRKLRQMTQTALAQRAFLSRGCIAKVERGLAPATPSVVAAVARVLQVDVAALTGQPYTPELEQDRLDRLIRPLSDALDMYDLGPDPEVVPRPLEQMEQDVRSLPFPGTVTA